jgi:hypothetical protein
VDIKRGRAEKETFRYFDSRPLASFFDYTQGRVHAFWAGLALALPPDWINQSSKWQTLNIFIPAASNGALRILPLRVRVRLYISSGLRPGEPKVPAIRPTCLLVGILANEINSQGESTEHILFPGGKIVLVR